MTLALAGDVMLGRLVAEEIGRREPASFWGDVRPLLLGADLVVANLECAITTHPVRWTRTPKVFHFRAPPAAVDVLRAGGIRLVSLANNHILDYEEQGLRDTLRHLDAAGIAHAGAGRDLAEAAQPAVVDAGGRCVGLIACTNNEPGWAAGPGRPGVHYLAIEPEPATLRGVETAADAARARGADVVVLSLHWGPNMVQRSPGRFRAFARGVLDRGVDVVYGHSAHLFHGVEIHRGKPILYDTGDFLDDYAVDPVLRNDRSLLFLAELDDAGVRELRMVPARLTFARVDRAVGRDAEEIATRMQALSAELGTRVERLDTELRIAVRTPG